jgi:hypothetical protein
LVPIFFTGFGLGIGITLYLQKQLDALGAPGYAAAFFGGASSMVHIFNQIQQWKRNKNAPILLDHGFKSSKVAYNQDKDFLLEVIMTTPNGEAS